MAKLSRSALKEIVKECLVEILSEGIHASSQAKALSGMTSTRPIQRSQASRQPRRSSLDTISYGSNSKKVVNENFNKNVNNAVENLTRDPVLSSIFKDTAMTTLQEQTNASVSDTSPVSHHAAVMTQGDTAARATAQSDPMEMFGGAAQNWESLAFSSSRSK